ncbi:Uncharacterized protein FWK35_00026822 [Aphis craccivora]|uniref:Uncharacterized protein n=1 Tax=Aphis craccivora TaxID=307492 RepID=A0A6G0VM54_APHCR|nr:Uncharacterized protein FWK35_00026822 [Aphis craccivora]
MSSGGLAINFSTGNYRMTGPPSRGSIKDKHARSLLTQLDASCVNGNFMVSKIIKLLLLPYLIPTKTQIKNSFANTSNKTQNFGNHLWRNQQLDLFVMLRLRTKKLNCQHLQNLIELNEEILKIS